MTALPLPPALVPVSVSFHLDTPSRSGGQSISGAEQVVSGYGGRWKASTSLTLYKAPAVQSFRALLAALQGRVGELLIGPHDYYRPGDINGRRLSQVSASSLGECSYLFDQSGFGQEQETLVTISVAGSLRATQLTFNIGNVEGPRPGQYFGIGERLYLVYAAWHDVPGNQLHVRFWPPLREAVNPGEPVILDRPVCRMRLASDDTGQLAIERRNFAASASIDLIESF